MEGEHGNLLTGVLGLIVLVACSMLACGGRGGTEVESPKLPPPPPVLPVVTAQVVETVTPPPPVLPVVTAQVVETVPPPQRARIMASMPQMSFYPQGMCGL